MLEPELEFDVLGPVLEDLLARLDHDISVSTRLSARSVLTPPDDSGRWRVAYFHEAGPGDSIAARGALHVLRTDDGRVWLSSGSWWTRFSDLDHVPRLVVSQTTHWLRSAGVSRWPRCRGGRRHKMRLEQAGEDWAWVCPETGARVPLGQLESRPAHRRPLAAKG